VNDLIRNNCEQDFLVELGIAVWKPAHKISTQTIHNELCWPLVYMYVMILLDQQSHQYYWYLLICHHCFCIINDLFQILELHR